MARLVRAQAKFVRVSPSKASLVAALVRGSEAQKALELLRLSPKAASKPIYKALHSAVSNAENNHKLDPARLVVSSITTTQGPSLKRYRPRARGSAATILKRSTHITVVVEEVAPKQKTAAKPASVAAKPEAAQKSKPAPKKPSKKKETA